MMALEKTALADKLHYSGSSGGGGGYSHPPHSGGGGGYGHSGNAGGGGHVYSSVGNSGYGYGSHHESSHHHGGGGGGKKSVALSALTLLAFLFFLHILQTCLQEQMDATTNTQVVVMSARLENKANDAQKRKGEVEEFDEDIEFIGKRNGQVRKLNSKESESEIDA
ncbi:hypothetical protein CBL_10680 [Carabus blaptoides fortunei]